MNHLCNLAISLQKVQIMNKGFFTILCFLLYIHNGYTQPKQKLIAVDYKKLMAATDTLKIYADAIVNGEGEVERFRADSIFIRRFVQALKTKYSFYYCFDSLKTLSILYPEDSSFRIFSWQVSKDFETHRQHAAIQMNTRNGQLQLFPLFDVSDFTAHPQDSVRDVHHWIGAIYYQIIQKTFQHKKYYTLIGYDENNARSTKKWIEVLHFNDQGKPLFGGAFFSFAQDSSPQSTAYRFSMEYKKDGRARLRYDKEMDMIIYDHLLSESNEPDKLYTLVPDGDYEGFKWINGQWMHVNKLFTFSLKDGEAPMPKPLPK